MPQTVTYQNPQFLLYGLTYLMLTPSPLQEALMGSPNPAAGSSLPNNPLPPLDEMDAATLQYVTDALSSAGFQNPTYVLTQFGAYLVHLTQSGIRNTMRDVLVDVLDDEYMGDPPCPPVHDTLALVGALESLAAARSNASLIQRVNKRIADERAADTRD